MNDLLKALLQLVAPVVIIFVTPLIFMVIFNLFQGFDERVPEE